MSKWWGAQSQRFDGIVQAIATSQCACWKVISPDSDILRNIKSASPQTETIVRIYTGAPTVDDVSQHPDPQAYGRDYATLVYSKVQDPQHMDLLESENEVNDHYGNLTEFIKRLNAFLVGFSGRAKQLGFRPLGPNFSTGYPECFIKGTDYELWPNAWQGLVDGLRALRDASGALSLHEYDSPDLFRLWSDSRQRGYLVGRHKAVYESLPSDLQSLPLYINEFGIDWLTQGVNGGFWHNGGTPEFMVAQAREAWKRIYSTTPQLKGITFFLWGATDPKFDEYDIRRTDTSIVEFTKLFSEDLTGDKLTTAQDRINRAWVSINIPFNPGAAFPKIAAQLGLGRPVGVEWTNVAGFSGQGFEKAFLESPAGDVLSAKPYDWLTGEVWVPVVVPPNPNPNPPTKRLTTADLPPEFGIVVQNYAPKAGEKFFGLVAAGPFKSGPQVGTQTTLVAVNESGSPVIGYSLTHAYDEANHKSETFPSPQVGVILGPGSYYTPPAQGGDRFYVSKGASPAGAWPLPYPCDVVIAGMPNGQHFEASYTFQLMVG